MSKIPNFEKHAYAGETVHWIDSGFTLRARISHDPFENPHDQDQPGWRLDTKDEEKGAENKAILDRWDRDEWWYATVTITALRDNVALASAGISGVEVNLDDNNDHIAGMIREYSVDGDAVALAVAQLQRLREPDRE